MRYMQSLALFRYLGCRSWTMRRSLKRLRCCSGGFIGRSALPLRRVAGGGCVVRAVHDMAMGPHHARGDACDPELYPAG